MSPRQRLTSPAYLPAMSAASNWCRNPNGMRKGAFCFVQSSSGTPAWDYCTIPPCSTPDSTLATALQDDELQEGDPPTVVGSTKTLICILVLSLIFILAGILVNAQKRRSAAFRRQLWQEDEPCSRLRTCWSRITRRWAPREPCLLADNVTFDNQSTTISV